MLSSSSIAIASITLALVSIMSKVDAAALTATSTTRTTIASITTPTGPAITVMFPADPDNTDTMYAKFVGITSGLTTVDFECGKTQVNCLGSAQELVTFGPNTIAGTIVGEQHITLKQNCDFNSEGGTCTFAGPADILGPGSATTFTSIVSSFGPDGLAPSKIVLTAGNTAALTASASSTSSASASASASNVSSSSASATSTSTKNEAKILAPGAMGAALMGLAAVLL